MIFGPAEINKMKQNYFSWNHIVNSYKDTKCKHQLKKIIF